MLKNRWISLFTCCLCLSFIQKGLSISPTYSGINEPWFTGPLLSPSARVVPVGHVNLEPYLFYTIVDGTYGSDWEVTSKPKFFSLTPVFLFKIGLTETLDLSGNIQGSYNHTQGQSGGGFGDLQFGLEYQLLKEDKKGWLPNIKFSIQESFPTGKYDELNPTKLGTDATGIGSYATNLGITFSKLSQYGKENFMNIRFNGSITYFAPVHVKGLSVYGGDPTTRGTAYPGNLYNFLFGAEYSLTQNWALAIDVQAFYSERNRFSGYSVLPVTAPSSTQISVAPAIEYNWSESMGVIAGPWFSVAGRNANRFLSYVAAYNFYY